MLATTTNLVDLLPTKLCRLREAIAYFYSIAPELPDRFDPPTVQAGDVFLTCPELLDRIPHSSKCFKAVLSSYVRVHKIPTTPIHHSPAPFSFGRKPEKAVHERSLSYSLRYALIPNHKTNLPLGVGYHFNHTVPPAELLHSYPNFWLNTPSARPFGTRQIWHKYLTKYSVPVVSNGRLSYPLRDDLHTFFRSHTQSLSWRCLIKGGCCKCRGVENKPKVCTVRPATQVGVA
jgi:hypothetical protein